MRKSLLATLLTLATIIPLAVYGVPSHSFAQTGTGIVQGDEFNNNVFAAPFQPRCGANAVNCPDPQGAGTWSLNTESPGNLRINTLPGTLLGSSATTNDARNFIVQPYSTGFDFTVTTKVTFPATVTSFSGVGQAAGILAYQNDDNFIYVGRIYSNSTVPQLQFLNEVAGRDTTVTVAEPAGFHPTVYLQLVKSGNTYTANYSFDGTTFTPFTSPVATPAPTAATATAVPTSTATAPQAYNVTFTTQPYVGLFAWGGSAGNVIAADFDWFRVGNPQTPAPTAGPTATGTVTGTPATVTPTTGPTATATTTAVATATATATNTTVPTATPTPRPKPSPTGPAFRYISIWYHAVRAGTFNHIEIQGSKRVQYGIWVAVYFPSGFARFFYQNTDRTGHWVKEFNIPRSAIGGYPHTAVVTFQLWRGKRTLQAFRTFQLVR